jgi:hypothetical protein
MAAPGPDESFLRPFMLTGGRTRPRLDGLRVETLVQAVPGALAAPLEFEQRYIVELCRDPVSVAEIAAAVNVPLGVARVLIADLLAGDLVRCLDEEDGELSIRLLERILAGIRAM